MNRIRLLFALSGFDITGMLMFIRMQALDALDTRAGLGPYAILSFAVSLGLLLLSLEGE